MKIPFLLALTLTTCTATPAHACHRGGLTHSGSVIFDTFIRNFYYKKYEFITLSAAAFALKRPFCWQFVAPAAALACNGHNNTLRSNHPVRLTFAAKNGLTAFALGGYSGCLSNPSSVTPQRHCGFFAPAICPASQAVLVARHSAAAAQLRLQSVYDGMTRQNTTPLWGNMPGGSTRPRVNPVTHSDPQPEWAITQKLVGANHG